jgi:tRNA (adenine37-N6)-methyltransferase
VGSIPAWGISFFQSTKDFFKNMNLEFTPIGTIHSPYKSLVGMPIQPSAAVGIKGFVELNKNLESALVDLDGFSHIYLIYYFHLSKTFKLKVKPFLEDQSHGLFSTRAPNRPNQIGLSVVKLTSIEQNVLHIENVDIIDGTPLLDIKPYVKQMEPTQDLRVGWLEKHTSLVNSKRSDDRFTNN